MKKTFLALGCALLLIGCATDNSLDYPDMDAYSSNDYETMGSYSSTLDNQPNSRNSYVYTPTSKARNKSKIVIKKTGKALPSLNAPAPVKTSTKSLPSLTVPAVPVKKASKSLPLLDTGTLSKIKSTPLSSPKKATKSAKPAKPAQCTVVKYKYITKVVTKKPSKATSTKSKKTSKSKSKRK